MATIQLSIPAPCKRSAPSQRDRSRKLVVTKQSANSDASGSSDEDLQWAQSCDVEALYNKYSHRALAFLSSRGLTNADAEDVMHQVWIRIYKSLQEKRFEGNFRPWLFQILRNGAIDNHRKKKPESFDPALAQDTFFTDNPPDAALIEAEYQAHLKNCMERLNNDAKTILKMRLGGEDYAAIAATLAINVPRAHRMFFDVKKAMTQCLSSKGTVS